MSETENGEGVNKLIRLTERMNEGGDQSITAFFDQLFEVLSDQRRRSLLVHLQTHGEMTIESLAATIAASERNTTIDRVRDDDVRSIRTELFHRHLPKLADFDFVDYDRDAGLVALTETGSRLDGRALDRTV